MPENKWQPFTPDGIANLAEMVEYTNGEFYDTKTLIRAAIFNIYNEGSTSFIDGEEVRGVRGGCISLLSPDVDQALFADPLNSRPRSRLRSLMRQ